VSNLKEYLLLLVSGKCEIANEQHGRQPQRCM
jgi:hypothetical protein